MSGVTEPTRAPPEPRRAFNFAALRQASLKTRAGLSAFAALLAIYPLLAGCGEANFGPVRAYAPPPLVYTAASYLQSGDKLRIIVYGEESLSGTYEISPDGTITMPLIGTIKVGGQTRSTIERIITDAYASRRFLKAPQVTISDVTYRPVYILGEVQTPGKYPYAIGLDALTAIATAGGFTARAGRTSVAIRHDNERVWQEYSLSSPLPIEPGDLIRVSESYF